MRYYTVRQPESRDDVVAIHYAYEGKRPDPIATSPFALWEYGNGQFRLMQLAEKPMEGFLRLAFDRADDEPLHWWTHCVAAPRYLTLARAKAGLVAWRAKQ